MVKPVILDVDTGIDDALGILYALRSPELRVEGITVTYGNVAVAQAARNTLQILELCGRSDVPVYTGAARPLLHPFEKDGSLVHGSNGLGGLALVATGPLTNLAMAAAQAPDVLGGFAEIVIMGGAVAAPGNVTAVAEANILSDPEAARLVFHAGARITLVGLDVTMQALLTPDDLARMAVSADHACRSLVEATRFYLQAYQGFYPGLPGCAMHDPLAVAVAADPTLVRRRRLYVDVECRGEATRGVTVGDLRGASVGPEPNLDVCLEVDGRRFLDQLLARLGA